MKGVGKTQTVDTHKGFMSGIYGATCGEAIYCSGEIDGENSYSDCDTTVMNGQQYCDYYDQQAGQYLPYPAPATWEECKNGALPDGGGAR